MEQNPLFNDPNLQIEDNVAKPSIIHDSDSFNDPSIIYLRFKYGLQGYGFYWAMIELLLKAKDYKIDMDVEVIAYNLNIKPEEAEQMIETCIEKKLFQYEDGILWSDTVIERQQAYQQVVQQKKNAAKSRWEKKDPEQNGEVKADADAMQVQCTPYIYNIIDYNILDSIILKINIEKDVIPELRLIYGAWQLLAEYSCSDGRQAIVDWFDYKKKRKELYAKLNAFKGYIKHYHNKSDWLIEDIYVAMDKKWKGFYFPDIFNSRINGSNPNSRTSSNRSAFVKAGQNIRGGN